MPVPNDANPAASVNRKGKGKKKNRDKDRDAARKTKGHY